MHLVVDWEAAWGNWSVPRELCQIGFISGAIQIGVRIRRCKYGNYRFPTQSAIDI